MPGIKVQESMVVRPGELTGWAMAIIVSGRLPAALISSLLLISGCINMSTPPAQITGSHSSAHNYTESTCDQLVDELGTLAQRETKLVAAQERRVKMSNVQALMFGVGQGDGAEATDLANVRGERESVRNAMVVKQCGK